MPLPIPVAICLASVLAFGAHAQESKPTTPPLPEAIRRGAEPKDIADLRAMEAHVQALLARVLPATVSLAGATGVIVDQRYVLTAAHVSRDAGRKLQITLPDGRRIDGVTLGANHRSDAGLIEITTKGDYPSCPMGKSADLERGQWCLMLGHPSGTKPGRTAPARLGRVLLVPEQGYLVTDCTMQSGDSGGPLFDMDGNVIGINSRINGDLAHNMHVPIDAFRRDWDKLLAREVIQDPRARRGARLGFGVTLDFAGRQPRVTEVAAGSSAAEAGIEIGDVIVRIADREVTDGRSYTRALGRRTEGEELTVQVQRGDDARDVRVKLQREGGR